MTMLNKYKYVGIGVGVLFIFSLFYVVCDRTKLEHKISYLAGQIAEQKKITLAGETVSAKVIKEQLAKIDELNGAIDSANTVIVDLEKGQTKAGNTIVKLNDTLAQAKTDAEKVPILESLVKEWSNKFSLAQNQLAEKDKIIFSLTEKYESQVRISLQYTVDWKNEKALRELGEKRSSLQDKRIRSLERRLKLRNVVDVLIVVGAGYLVLSK